MFSKEPMFCTERVFPTREQIKSNNNNEMLGEEMMITSSLIIVKGDPLTVLKYNPFM